MKNIRNTKEYKGMTNYMAVGVAEGFEEADSAVEVLAAWQYIVDMGLTKSLQGWFGRTASNLIENGLIEAAV